MDGQHFESHAPIAARATTSPESDAPLATLDASTIVDALLRAPARLVGSVREGGVTPRLVAIALTGTLAIGLAMGTWSAGLQLLLVPLKLAGLVLVTALVCLPSLHVLSAMSGGAQPIRVTAGALAMGVALASVLAVALVPIAWVLSAATSALSLAGALYLVVVALSITLGLGLTRRALGAAAGGNVRGLGAWSVMFFVVGLQLATTLRPLVGAFDGFVLHERTFFLTHLVDCLVGA